MEAAEAVQQMLPQDSNWITVLTLGLVAVILFFRDGLPFLKRKVAPAEVKTELAPEDRQIIAELRQEVVYLRGEFRGFGEKLSELLVLSKVAAELRGKTKA